MQSIQTCAALVIMVAAVPNAFADPLSFPVQKILPPYSSASNLYFGNQVDIDRGHLVVNGPTSGVHGGESYLYTLTNGSWQHETTVSGPIADTTYFGFASKAAISVGDNSTPTRILGGGGQVFEESTAGWIESGLLPGFGAIDGDTAITRVAGPAAAVSHFENGLWTTMDQLTPSFPDLYGLDGGFGETIVISGDDLLISASSQDYGPAIINSGAVFAYERAGTQWLRLDAIVPSDPIWRGKFGFDIDVDDGTLLAGRPAGGPAAEGPFQGIAYVYEKIGGDWVETARLQASDGFPDDGFGSNVAISSDLAAVASKGSGGEGRVYLFQRHNDDWSELGWLETGELSSSVQFGFSVALDGKHIVVGARLDGEIGLGAGAVYVYSVPEPNSCLLLCIGVLGVVGLRRRHGKR